ncbi:hypothetical protein [Paenibacillus nanensis]|uniref:hypothetical protein n=1 Tax=Paenibacillus nanensis TaxID=393251 RepID=UPI0011C426D0|nr:hypothetical protein [Paenibacillus nanensis]
MNSFISKLSLGLTAAIIVATIPLTGSAFAKSTQSEEVYSYLKFAGYPNEVIAELDDAQKQAIYNEKLVYSSHTKENNFAFESAANTPQFSTFTTTGNWTRTLVASKVTTPTKGKNEFVLDYNWTWNNNPDFALMDKFGIAWSDDFDAYPESAVYAYRATGYNSVRNETRDYSTGNVPGYKEWNSAAGVGWEYDIKDFFYYNNLSYVVNTHKGWGRIKIGKYSNKSGTTESTSAVGSYFHKYGAFTGTLSFSPAPSVSISYATNYDKFADAGAAPFSWTNYNW